MSPTTVATTNTGRRVLTALGAALNDLGGDLLPAFVDALVAELDATDLLLTPVTVDRVLQPGTPLSDATRTPYPAWLAQVAGQVIPAGTPVAVARQQLLSRRVDTRGTPAALIAAARAAMGNPTANVRITERDGSPYKVTVTTFSAQTANPSVVLAALQAEKPVGLVLSLVVAAGQNWADVKASNRTFDQLKLQSVNQVREAVPPT